MPVFIPQEGCPHRCAFCNQCVVTGVSTRPSLEEIGEEINRFLQYRQDHHRGKTEISFYGGNFLGQSLDIMRDFLKLATGFVQAGKADGIRFSTRPDTVDERRLEILSDYPVSTIEIGAQSMDDQILKLSKRGHFAEDTIQAVHLLKKFGYVTGLQMMVGLPGEDVASSLMTGVRIASLSPDFVRIYPTLVIRGSLLEKWYRAGHYDPLDLPRCIERVKALSLLFSGKKIPVARIGLQANEGLDTGRDLVAGPYHPAMGQVVASEIFFDKAVSGLSQSEVHFEEGVHLVVHPRMISNMRGQKNVNLQRLEKHFPHMGPIKVITDPDLPEADVAVTTPRSRHCCRD